MLADAIQYFQEYAHSKQCVLVAVTKTYPVEVLVEAYTLGLRVFGENRVQELVEKYHHLPKDIAWHMIGHLQSNKVKQIAPFISLIHSVDSLSLLQEIDKQAAKNNRVISCLLQMHISEEDTKFGLYEDELKMLVGSKEFEALRHVKIVGLMGMATHTTDEEKIRKEFRALKNMFDKYTSFHSPTWDLQVLSMGMSGDYKIALEEGSTMIRVGSALFGRRA